MVGTQEQREDPEGGGTGLLGTEGQRDGLPHKEKTSVVPPRGALTRSQGACASKRETRRNGERIQWEEGQVGDAQ